MVKAPPGGRHPTPPPALRWRADGFRAYAKFRRYVRLEIAAYPDGVAARRFAALPGSERPRPKSPQRWEKGGLVSA